MASSRLIPSWNLAARLVSAASSAVLLVLASVGGGVDAGRKLSTQTSEEEDERPIPLPSASLPISFPASAVM